MAAVSPLGVAGTVEGLAALGLAAVLLLASGRRPAPMVLGLNFVAFGAILLVLSIPEVLGHSATPGLVLWAWVARLVLWTSLIGFASIYPRRRLSPRRAWFLAWSGIPALAVLCAFLLAPSLLRATAGGPTAFFKDLVTTLRDVGLLLSLGVFGWLYLRSEAGPQRHQFVYIFVPYAVYGLNDGLSDIWPLVQAGKSPDSPYLTSLLGLSLLLTFGMALLVGLRLVRERGPTRRDDALLLACLLVALPASFLQFTPPGSLAHPSLFLHFIVDGFAVLVLFYGVARENVFNIDLTLKWTIRRGTVPIAILAVLFVGSQVAQNFLTQGHSVWVGGVAAGLMLFAINPLQRMAERLADSAFPKAKATHQLDEDEKTALYRHQLELAWADGHLTRNEQLLLRNLRERLHIPLERAEAIEANVMATLRSPAILAAGSAS